MLGGVNRMLLDTMAIRGGWIFLLWRVEFFKIGKRGLLVYQRDESSGKDCGKLSKIGHILKIK